MQHNASTINVFSTEEVIGLATTTVLIIVLSVPANALVLFAYLTSPSARRKAPNYLLVNVTISEFITALLVIPLQLAAHTINSSLAISDGTVCKLVGILSYPFYIVSVGTMVCISIDRSYAVRSPLRYKVKMTGKRIAGMIAYTWTHALIFVIVFGFIIGVGHNEVSGECGILWDQFHIAVSVLVAMIHIVLPLVLLTVLNCSLVRSLRKQNRTLKNHLEEQLSVVIDRNSVRRNKARQAQERKVTRMVLWIISTYLICWIPYFVTRSLYMSPVTTSPLIDAIAVLILHFSVVINPVLNLTFRKELRSTIERLFKKRNAVTSMDIGSPTFLSTVDADVSRIVVGRCNRN